MQPVHGDAEAALALQQSIRDIVVAMRRCPQPFLGIVQGAASGGRLALALACDIRLMAPDARMNAASINVELIGCDIGVSYFLNRMVGTSVTAELILTGCFIDAKRAAGVGHACRVDTLPQLH